MNAPKPGTKPVVFFAIANDKNRPLHNLPEELRQVRKALEPARDAELCEWVERSNTTPEDLLNVFLDKAYRHRVAVFHFAGHAGDYHLLLERANDEAAIADAGSLADFLKQQRGLQLVFLNGCSTQAQVERLHKTVPVVIATSQAIRDDAARKFAELFYKSLGGGSSLAEAFENANAGVQFGASQEAKVGVQLATSVSYRELYLKGHEETSQPWQLFVKPGAEDAAEWNLPDAAGNPLRRLPPLRPSVLPVKPFRHLDWFTRDDAEVFFGRDYEILDLFGRVTGPVAAPILLLYGQSGVGKSSLLAAGLMPRLEDDFKVHYVRRDAQLGLTAGLERVLRSGDAFYEVWHRLETELGRPLVVILDQVEEVFTRKRPEDANELETFLEAIVPLFLQRDAWPKGKLVLSFRKEWLAELEARLLDVQLSYSKVFVQPLDRRGIAQAVNGPTRSERLRSHYGLNVAPELPEIIADDLLEDTGSPVAPTLQVLLTKLWDAATAQSQGQPEFTLELYRGLKRDGILLADFLEQQLAALHTWRPEVITSGLALDLLALHTTPLGTAAQRTVQELQALYPHRADLPELLQKCRDLYLLTDASGDGAGAAPATRLAHDTLAPLVRERFEASAYPGQQAWRILESRARDWQDGAEGTPLDARDLATVEGGAAGMRVWQAAERRLISTSRTAATNRQAFALVFGGAVSAGFGLGLLRVLVVALSESSYEWGSRFLTQGFSGIILGTFVCLGLVLPQLLKVRRQASKEIAHTSAPALLQFNLPAILSGALGFALGSLLLALVVASRWAPLKQSPRILPADLLAGLGLSVALAGYPRLRSNVRWLPRLSIAAVAFVLAQWLLVMVDSSASAGQIVFSAGQVVFSEDWFEKNYRNVYDFLVAQAETSSGTPAQDNPAATQATIPETENEGMLMVNPRLPQPWYAWLSLLDAALVAIALTLGAATGLKVASRQLGMLEEA